MLGEEYIVEVFVILFLSRSYFFHYQLRHCIYTITIPPYIIVKLK